MNEQVCLSLATHQNQSTASLQCAWQAMQASPAHKAVASDKGGARLLYLPEHSQCFWGRPVRLQVEEHHPCLAAFENIQQHLASPVLEDWVQAYRRELHAAVVSCIVLSQACHLNSMEIMPQLGQVCDWLNSSHPYNLQWQNYLSGFISMT